MPSQLDDLIEQLLGRCLARTRRFHYRRVGEIVVVHTVGPRATHSIRLQVCRLSATYGRRGWKVTSQHKAVVHRPRQNIKRLLSESRPFRIGCSSKVALSKIHTGQKCT